MRSALCIGHFDAKDLFMWKLLIGFIAFAALAMFILTRPGADIDLGGEKHDVGGPADSTTDSAASAASAASR